MTPKHRILSPLLASPELSDWIRQDLRLPPPIHRQLPRHPRREGARRRHLVAPRSQGHQGQPVHRRHGPNPGACGAGGGRKGSPMSSGYSNGTASLSQHLAFTPILISTLLCSYVPMFMLQLALRSISSRRSSPRRPACAALRCTVERPRGPRSATFTQEHRCVNRRMSV